MEDTIAAIATPLGEGGIGIIRISGENSLKVLNKIFVPVNNSEILNRRMIYGNIVDPISKKVVDEVLCVYMKGPKTYTTEDVVEINCHGGIVSLRNTLNLVLRNGSRLAEPGEFTKRAFLNGRLDLSQAEAVIDVVKAKTDKTFDVALNQLDGNFSKYIKEIRKQIVDILVNITVNIDYPDEDIEQITYENLINDLKKVCHKIDNLIDSSSTGRIIQEGLRVAIIGKPNVGKSSLMNSLLKETRAIVTEIPGTTRDTIEENISIKGIPIIITDTAGIRETDDVIEKIGIEKSKESFNNADLVIFIMDRSRNISDEDKQIIEYINGKKTIILLNKIDLEQKVTKEEIEAFLPDCTLIETSMENSTGLKQIEKEITNFVYSGKIKQNDNLFVTNVRHKNLLENSSKSLSDAINMSELQEALEFIEIDVNSAYESLGEIIGETVQDDIINEVFARFCLGK